MSIKSKLSVIHKDKSLPHHRAVLYIQGLPEDTKAAFKAAAARQGKTMRDVVIEFMREYSQRVVPQARL